MAGESNAGALPSSQLISRKILQAFGRAEAPVAATNLRLTFASEIYDLAR
jgi:hypothetical protein